MTCQSKDNSETPILSNIKIAAPCDADWQTMVGTDRERFCSSCALNVYNISTMSSPEAEQFLAERAGSRVCVQFYRRKDGTILSDNCPKGLRALRDRGRQLLKIASSIVAFLFSTTLSAQADGSTRGKVLIERGEPSINQPLMGKPAMPAPAVDAKALQAQLLKKISQLQTKSLSSDAAKIELAKTHNDLAQSYSGCSNFQKADEQFTSAGKILKKIKSQRAFYANVLLNQAAALKQDKKEEQAKALEAQAAKLTN